MKAHRPRVTEHEYVFGLEFIADKLGISRRTLMRALIRYGIDLPAWTEGRKTSPKYLPECQVEILWKVMKYCKEKKIRVIQLDLPEKRESL